MLPTGYRTFARAIIAKTIGGTHGAAEYARTRWGDACAATMLVKAGVGAVTSTSPMSAVGSADDEFWPTVVDASIPGRLQGLRRVPFNVRLLSMATGARGYWVGQSRAIPVSKPVLAGSSLSPLKVGAIIVMTKESMTAANPQAEARFEEDLRNAVVGALDEAFLDPANAGISGEMAPAVTHGAQANASSGDPAIDVAWLISNFSGDLSQAYFVTDPVTAAEIALYRVANGTFAFPDAGPRGGSILGMPLLTTRHSTRDTSGGSLALIDPSGIASNLEGVEVMQSTQATIEMSDAPTGRSDTPVALSAVPVSLFQNELVALRATIRANWERQRDSVAVVTGADYPLTTP